MDLDSLLSILYSGLLSLTIFGVILAYLYWKFAPYGRFQNTLSRMAKEEGLDYKCDFLLYPAVSGLFRGREVNVDQYERYGGRRSRPNMRIRVGHNGIVTDDMVLEPSSIRTALKNKMGATDSEVGIDRFDQAYRVGIKDEGLARELLDIEIQQKLLKAGIWLKITGDAIYHKDKGLNFDEETILARMNIMADLAEKLEKIRPQK
jgi:hypothetical protein